MADISSTDPHYGHFWIAAATAIPSLTALLPTKPTPESVAKAIADLAQALMNEAAQRGKWPLP